MEEEEEEEVVFKGGVTASASQYPVYMIFFFWQGIRCVGEIMREFASTLLRNYEDLVFRCPPRIRLRYRSIGNCFLSNLYT